ncbi:DUF1190 domain-containing protein, partial [Salmonella enterica subsp. enterica serovar Infantis]
ENQAQAQQTSVSILMQIMSGYMMRRMMCGVAGFEKQQLCRSKNKASPSYPKYTDAEAKNNPAAQPERTKTVHKTSNTTKTTTTTTNTP